MKILYLEIVQKILYHNYYNLHFLKDILHHYFQENLFYLYNINYLKQ